MATEVPTTANGGITNGGKTYTFHIKPGVDWNTSPARQVTSADFVREFKAFFNPVSPVGNPVYYKTTIAGLTAYANAETAYFAKKSNAPTAANITNFQNTHKISGITTPNTSTMQFTLIAPASDFLYMMAMPFTSARPVEYDSYVPNSLQLDQHTISDGPYQISSYIPGKSITLVRNPAWKQSTDPIRHDYVASIVTTLGVTSAETQLSDMEAGTEDLPSPDTPINPASIPSLVASKVPNFVIWPNSDTFPYIVFNLRSPDANSAMQKLLVRQAVEYGLDKAAAVKAIGGPDVASGYQHGDPAGQHRIRELQPVPGRQRAGQRGHVQVRPDQGRVSERAHADLHVPERLVQHPDLHRDPGVAGELRDHPDREAGARLVVLRRPGQLPGEQQGRRSGTWASPAGSPTGSATTGAPSSRPCSRVRTASSTRSTTAATTTRP